MTTIKTSELTGAALDWAVGYIRCFHLVDGKPILARDLMKRAIENGMASPSTDWAQGGPIIEREGISLACRPKDARGLWCAVLGPNRFLSPDFECYGPTLLIAAMRCYVASKLGDTVEIPEELAP